MLEDMIINQAMTILNTLKPLQAYIHNLGNAISLNGVYPPILTQSVQAQRTFWDYIVLIIQRYGSWFIEGAAVTMLIALVGTIVGFLIGLLIGILRTIPISKAEKKNSVRQILLKAMNFVLSCYIEVFRGTPMIIQATVIYYGLMEGFQIDLSPLTAGLLVVSINTGAYMAEVVRGGIESIDNGQTEAAHAIGMSHTQTMINVILPQAIRNILPATGNEFIINIKDTAVLNVINVTELFFNTKSVRGAMFRNYEVFLIAAVIYLFLTFTTSRLLRLLEKKMDGPESYNMLPSEAQNTDP